MIFRILFFILLVCIATTLPVYVTIVCAFLYALKYTAFELIILAFLLDGLYGDLSLFGVPVYTTAVVIGLLIVEWVKPRIFVYNQ